MPNYDSDMGAKAMNRAAEAYPTESRKIAGGQVMPADRPTNLNGIVIDRRSYHFENVLKAYQALTDALDGASDDGFFFTQQVTGGPNTLRSIDAVVPTPVRVPRAYEVELNCSYNPPV
jgi:hypothetical protein